MTEQQSTLKCSTDLTPARVLRAKYLENAAQSIYTEVLGRIAEVIRLVKCRTGYIATVWTGTGFATVFINRRKRLWMVD